LAPGEAIKKQVKSRKAAAGAKDGRKSGKAFRPSERQPTNRTDRPKGASRQTVSSGKREELAAPAKKHRIAPETPGWAAETAETGETGMMKQQFHGQKAVDN
jgi:hypothetical protein